MDGQREGSGGSVFLAMFTELYPAATIFAVVTASTVEEKRRQED